MEKIWHLSKLAAYTKVEKNMFIVTFATEIYKQRVVNGKPWLFDSHLFALQNLEGACQLVETIIDTESFWIQLYDLPFQFMNRRYENLIGDKLGKVLEIDVNDDDTRWGEYLRIRVEINLNKPLTRGRALEFKRKKLWIPLKYEKLSRFYFLYGSIAHTMKCNPIAANEG